MALDRNITWLIIKSDSSYSVSLKGFFSAAFSLGSFQCPIPLGEEVQEVAETSGFLAPSFIGAHPDPHCWTLQNSLIHIQTFSLFEIKILGLC